MVEADERLGDDEAALGEPVPVCRELHGRLERRDVVVGEVADDGQVELLCLVERDEAGARSHPRAPPEAAALDRLEQEARAAHRAQAEVRAERREEVGDERRRRVHEMTVWLGDRVWLAATLARAEPRRLKHASCASGYASLRAVAQ